MFTSTGRSDFLEKPSKGAGFFMLINHPIIKLNHALFRYQVRIIDHP